MRHAQLRILLLNDRAYLQEAALVIRNNALALLDLLGDYKFLATFSLALILKLLDCQKLVLDYLL